MKTFAEVMTKNKGHTTGFDYLRIFLATAVVLDHSIIRDGAASINEFASEYGLLVVAILPAFFALSGFLVASSLTRNSIPEFITLRVLRLFPALAVEVTLSALLLGTIFTTLPLPAYFADPMFHRYFLNMVGIINFPLPGVFDGAKINPQLWTIPVELDCYLVLVAIGLFGLVQRRWWLLGLVAGGIVVATVISFFHPLIIANHMHTGRTLVFAFLCAALMHYFRDRLVYHPALFVASILAAGIGFSYPLLGFLATPPIAYIVAYIGVMRLPPIKFGDLSYGLFLFHFPIIHVINRLTNGQLTWYELFAAVMVVAGAFAALSWTFIEKPLLARKTQVLVALDRALPARITKMAFLNPKESADFGRKRTRAMPPPPAIAPDLLNAPQHY